MGIICKVLVDGIPPDGPITSNVFPNLSAAVRAVTERAQEVWLDYANGATLPDGQRIQNRTGEYARSIRLRQTGDFSGEVFSELPYADAIEHGTRERDLKDILRTSMKVRATKDGRRYLIIPFRWNSPTSVLGRNAPVEVWNWWRSSSRSSSAVLRSSERRSGTGTFDVHTRQPMTVPAWSYSWRSRLEKDTVAKLGLAPDERMARRVQGMVRFRTEGEKGGAAHSQLLTFRRMMEGSPGWKVPAQPGRWPARQTEEQVRPEAEERFQNAIQADVAALLGDEDL